MFYKTCGSLESTVIHWWRFRIMDRKRCKRYFDIYLSSSCGKCPRTFFFCLGPEIFSSCTLSSTVLFLDNFISPPPKKNLNAEYIIWNAGLDDSQAGIKIAMRNINKLRYADDTTLMAEIEEELKSLLMTVKEEGGKSWLKTQHSKNEDHGT